MVELLSGQDIARALPYSTAIATLERGFLAFARGELTVPPRLVVQEPYGLLACMPAAGDGSLSVKVATVHSRNVAGGLPTVLATVLLMDWETGRLRAVLDGTVLTLIRTAGASALATRYLAAPGPAVLGVLGTGPLALAHVRALATVKPLERVWLWSPNAHQRWDQIALALADLEVEVRLAVNPQEVVTNSPLIVLATSSQKPVLEWEWVRRGAHINAVGSHAPAARELDEETVSRSRIICDSTEACWAEAGDLMIPLREGKIDKQHAAVGLGDVLLGRAEGRANADEVTVFKSVGVAFEDLFAAIDAWRNARALGLGAKWTN